LHRRPDYKGAKHPSQQPTLTAGKNQPANELITKKTLLPFLLFFSILYHIVPDSDVPHTSRKTNPRISTSPTKSHVLLLQHITGQPSFIIILFFLLRFST
jgi:hypothetical protein